MRLASFPIKNGQHEKRIEVKVDEILRPLEEAEISLDLAESMQLGEPKVVALTVDPNESVGIVNSAEATLTGSGFKIESITGEVQPVNEVGPTEWRWEVTPIFHLGLRSR